MTNLRDLPEIYQACLRTAAQGKRSRRVFDGCVTCCAYEDEDGNACAVGQCLTPELRETAKDFQGTVNGLMKHYPEVRNHLKTLLHGEPLILLAPLQDAHDSTQDGDRWAEQFWRRLRANLCTYLTVPPWHEVQAEVAAIKESKHEDATHSPQ